MMNEDQGFIVNIHQCATSCTEIIHEHFWIISYSYIIIVATFSCRLL